MLTPYEGTPFEQSVREGVYRLKDEDELYDMFVLINSYLETQGFLRYELSNWSKRDTSADITCSTGNMYHSLV